MSDPTAPCVVEGLVEPGFERVRDAFAANLASGEDLGASFAVVRDGRLVVDLWGGFADQARTRPWRRDTLANVWSTTKGLASLCVAMLVDRGRLSWDQPVAGLWPEFAQAGKDSLTVAEVMSHQGGLSGFADKVTTPEFADHDRMAAKLAAQAPMFERGQSGYHAITHGFLSGEIVRRAAGRSLGRFFAETVAGPLAADAWIGLPDSEDDRVAEMVAAPRGVPVALPPHPAARAALANPPLDAAVPNQRWWRACEIPSVNAQATARGLATIYGNLARSSGSDGARLLLSDDALVEATKERVRGKDLVLGIPTRWGAGFSLNDGVTWGKNRRTFGHSGWGGSFACADPDAGLGIAYAMNRMGSNLRGDPRSLRLVAATYASLE